MPWLLKQNMTRIKQSQPNTLSPLKISAKPQKKEGNWACANIDVYVYIYVLVVLENDIK